MSIKQAIEALEDARFYVNYCGATASVEQIDAALSVLRLMPSEPVSRLVFDAAMPAEVAKWLSDHPPTNFAPVAAIAALRSMPQGEPVAWGMCKNGLILDCITPAEHESYEGEYTVPLFGAAQTAPMPVKIPIPPPQADPLDVVYAEGWNACCDAFFGGKPPIDPVVITITERDRPLSDAEIRRWWGSENGLEDMDMCKIDDFIALVRAVEASQRRLFATPHTEAVRMSEAWQPIDSAPKDGTPVLIYQPDSSRKKVMEAWWALEYEDGPGYWQTPIGPTGRGYTILPKAVTHWQPLPPPPVEQATAERLGVTLGDV